MIVYFDVEERYPVYDFAENKRTFSIEMDVDEETVDRWKSATKMFWLVQEEIAATAKAQDKRF